jgi:hypothetical protein
MKDRDRLDQLRELLDRLEEMPASADRDWMLAEVRARWVDVETGVAPAPLRALPQNELDAESIARRTPRREPVRVRPTKPVGRAQVVEPAAGGRVSVSGSGSGEGVVDLLEQGGVMSLEEPPAAAIRAWSAGLRG